MSTTDQIVTLFESLSFAEKLSLNERLATAMRKEGGAGKKRSPKAKDGDKPKRKAALGTLAWMAYVKHIKTTKPDALDGLTKEAEKLGIIKGIRAEDPEGYKTFVAAWKDEHKDDASEAEAEAEDEDDSASVASAPAAAVLTPVQKIAALKAAKAKAAEAKPEPKAEAKAEPKAEAKAKPTPAKKATATPGAPKKAVKAAKKEEMTWPVLEIDDVEYWHDPGTNYLWLKTGEDTTDGLGDGVGYFQPDNAEEPIRMADFGDA